MLKIKFALIKALAKFWAWKCPSCKSANRIFYSPYAIDHVKCQSCELEYEITDVPARSKQGRGYDWEPSEEVIFANRYPDVPNSVLADQFGRKPYAIQNKATQLKVYKTEPAKMKAWEQSQAKRKRSFSGEDIEWMREAVKTMSNAHIAELLGKSYWSVVSELKKRKITRK